MENLDNIVRELGDCKRCKLHSTRKTIVFGVGDSNANLMFIGEAPGADEDEKGEPFIGRAGKLLTSTIESIGITRSDVYICNIVKCRPPGNRDPQPDEIEACFPFLDKQIEAVNPKVIVTLGSPSTRTLLKSSIPISSIRGKWQTYKTYQVLPTFHPSYVMRKPTSIVGSQFKEDLVEALRASRESKAIHA